MYWVDIHLSTILHRRSDHDDIFLDYELYSNGAVFNFLIGGVVYLFKALCNLHRSNNMYGMYWEHRTGIFEECQFVCLP